MSRRLTPYPPGHSAIDFSAAFAAALQRGDGACVAGRTHPIVAVLCDLSVWRPWSAEARVLIDAPERARVDRLRDAADREERALAYALHRFLLGAWLREAPMEVPLYRDEAGRPRLSGMHGRVCTSLSHPRGFAAFAISDAGSVGIDLEPVAHAGAMEEIARLATHADERDVLAHLGDADRADALLAIWVRKEAYLKAEGVGLQRPPSTFAAPAGVPLPATDVAAGLEVRMLDAGARHKAAIALPVGSDVQVVWWWPPASP
ncbi:4'-phosphopantetheinyl transferase superfamily protein [Pseudoxanthomonas sp. PXM01]|uniref:4'-phosphopantetheinyl transferase family protein n=1 Tax=Pseudoxanthomonas sp. PXM01 TaxID=2769295 RepID=UPI001783E6D2|nr:4'-phosphopantetheinyl transferase superfamily protein [Pseudoxanthomonas sp. PXM01]MBD9468350.1 4'-phosphopantetheinyl transferase superfamily protein [Pseudoxanthomonas sp. PXM01]